MDAAGGWTTSVRCGSSSPVKLQGKVSGLKVGIAAADFEITHDTGSIKCHKWSTCVRDSKEIYILCYVERSRDDVWVSGLLVKGDNDRMELTTIWRSDRDNEDFNFEFFNLKGKVIELLQSLSPSSQGLHHDDIANSLKQPLENVMKVLQYLVVTRVVSIPSGEHYKYVG